MDHLANFVLGTLNQGYSDVDVSVDLITGDGAKFPDPAVVGEYNATWWNATDFPNASDDPYKEIVRITAKSGDTLTITRAQESTVASAKNLANKTYRLVATVTAKTFTDLEEEIAYDTALPNGSFSDGNVTVSTTISLTSDMYYDTLTVSSTGVINTEGYRIYAKDIILDGTIQNIGKNGGNGTTRTDVFHGIGAAGGAPSAITVPGGVYGSAGGAGGDNTGTTTGGPPNNPSNLSNSIGVNGVSGGTGGTSGDGSAGATATIAGTFATVSRYPKRVGEWDFGAVNISGAFVFINTSRSSIGGGGGGGVSGQTYGGGGGGGGGSGGCVFLCANTITISATGVISVVGGSGGDGGNGESSGTGGYRGGGGGGGGGGGSGGTVILMYRDLVNNGTINLGGGSGGSGGAGGTAPGGNGSSGTSGASGLSGVSYFVLLK